MHKSLMDILVDPMTKRPLRVKVRRYGPDKDILEGTLHGSNREVYVITNGIPRFTVTEDKAQRQTGDSFGFKWRQSHTYNSPQFRTAAQKWLVQRYGFKDLREMSSYLDRGLRILDAGCGSGFSTSLWMDSQWRGKLWVGVDISAAIDVARERLRSVRNTQFVQADLLQLPFPENVFDLIIAEGVLHHTASTELALRALLSVLKKGGEIMFYVYRRKGAIREFTDDYIRSMVSSLPPEEAWNTLRPLTRLGQALAELHTEVEVPEDIPYLGIKAGRYDIQRLIYWHFAKLFWNGTFSFEENNHVNFDWYHPQYAHRQSEEEIRRWCNEAGLSVIHFDMEQSGFTVRGIKG